MREEEEYCDVCKAELKKGPELVFAIDEEEEQEVMDLCPKCHQNYLKPGETICSQCAKLSQFEDDNTNLDDDSWKEYLDDDDTEEEEDTEEMLSLAKLAEEEGEELFEDEEEEIEMHQSIEPDDFDYGDIDQSDFEEEDDEDELEDEDDEDEDF